VVEPSEGAFDDPAPVQEPSWQTLIDRDDDMERLMDSEKEGDAVGRKVVQQLQHDGAEAWC
jgi:hypothetical protein